MIGHMLWDSYITNCVEGFVEFIMRIVCFGPLGLGLLLVGYRGCNYPY